MAEIVKFVYVMIILFYVFLVSMNIDAFDGHGGPPCTKVSDCPPNLVCKPGYKLGCSANYQCICYMKMSF
ncbi:putative Late nodulin [Medicago truncatula]|uniref:Nodule Cysteine-Rich (NCR) secreted peptide n=1 Tax=Medicago truncatula TaxID=3880 RepID=A0A072U8T2_MEDTR|nr:Nodule Cysteine-Rich (NCR) secreted peptide [Medicago truncatula]RHN51311.1 putative Late nodulin [Medicago truncatula]